MMETRFTTAAFVLASTALLFDPSKSSASPQNGGHLRRAPRRTVAVDGAMDRVAAKDDAIDDQSLLVDGDHRSLLGDDAVCMEQASGIDLGCTAQDIKFDRVTGFEVLGGPALLRCNCSSAVVTAPACATEHDVDCGEYDVGTVFGACNGGNGNGDVVVQMTVDFLVSTTRYDVGMYIATDGGSALDGEACHISSLQHGTYGDVQVWEVEGDTTSPNPAPDNCLDLGSTGVMTDYPFAPVTLSCTDSNDDGLLDFDVGIVWSVKKGDYDCDIDDAAMRPVASSSPKCWYDEEFRATIPIYVSPEPIVETASPTLSPIQPPAPPTSPIDCSQDFNLCFALDMSGSVCNDGLNINCNECGDPQCQDPGHTIEQCCSNFEKVRQFTAVVANSLDELGIGTIGTSVVEFATGATTASFLTTNVTETLIGLDGMAYTGGWTDHSDAITVCEATFPPASGEGDKNVIVLVTDGVATRPATSTLTPDQAALSAATAAKDAGTTILPVFISESNSASADAYMSALSSDGTVYNADDFEALNEVIGSLVDRVLCRGVIAVDDYTETPKNVAVQIDVLPNDIGNGTLRVNPNLGLDPANGLVYPVEGPVLTSLNYIPDPDFEGTDTFEYEMCDSNDECDTAVVTVEVLSLPVAIDDYTTTPMNTPVTIDVLPNDVHDDTASITEVTQPNGQDVGVVTIVPGMVSYDPPTGFLGTEMFTYTICQSSDSECDTATVTVDIVRPGPDAIDDSAETTMQVPVTIPVLANDVGDGTLVVNNIADSPNNGTVYSGGTLGENVVYYPEDGFQGTDTFTYVACDAWDMCDEAVVTVVVGPPAIAAINDLATTPHGTPVNIDILANDQGVELETEEIPTAAQNGVTEIQVDGTVTYTPNHLFFGNDTFTYRACEAADGTACDIATVSVHVPIPDILAVDDTKSTPENTPVDVLVLVNDIGDSLTLESIPTPPLNGTVQIDGDKVIYTPSEDFDGVDTFTYEACNGDSQCDTATVTVTVPDFPIEAVDDEVSTPKDTPVTIPVLTNDIGEDLTVDSIPDTPGHGVVNILNNEVVYTPNDDDYIGPDIFTYTACIGDSVVCDTATVIVNVEMPAIETVDDTTTTPKNTPVDVPVLTNDHGVDLTLESFPNDPSNGAVEIVNNEVVYTPTTDYTGPDTFTYRACNGNSAVECDTATVTVTVEPPVIEANNDSTTTPKRTPITVSVLPNDIGENLIVQNTTKPPNGVVEIVDNEVVYTPDPDFDGQDAFTYEACTSGGVVECDIATVVVTVEPPVIGAVDDTTTTPKDTPVDIPVLINDVGDLLVIDPNFPDEPNNGVVVIENDVVVYTPNDEYVGQDTFTYRACLGDTNDCDTATVTVTVDPPAVVAYDDSTSTPKRTPVTIPVLDNDFGDGIVVHQTIPDQPDYGTVSVQNDQVVYTPTGDYIGPDTFTYQACVWTMDAYGECDTAIVTVNVQNQPPVAHPDTVQMDPEDRPTQIINVLENDEDPDDDILSVGVGQVTEPDNGFVGICGDSQCVTYTPDQGFSGLDVFEYLACDTDNSCDAAEVTVIVNPDIVDDNESVMEGEVVAKDVLENDVGTNLVVEFVAPPANGECVIAGGGVIEYTPDVGFVGQDQCMYTACTSGTAACGTARLIVDVIAEPTWAPSAMPSASPTEAWYYPDWINDAQVCKNDFAEPEYMLEVQRKNYLYRSKELCCQNHFWWRITQCMANEHPMYYSTGDKCDQKVFFEFHESKYTPADWSSSDLFETLEQCCTHKFGWDVHGCMASSPRELKYYFTLDVQQLAEPAFCQDADIMANALVTALEMGFDEDMRANVTSIGCATLARNPDTGNPECGGCLAGNDFLGGTDGQTVVNDATGVVTPITVEIRKKCYESKTAEDVVELTDYITDLLQGLIAGSLTQNIQTWSRDRIPAVGQLFDSVVDPGSFTFLNVINPFAPKDTKYYPDWVQAKTCVNDGLEPPYMQDSPEDYMFDTVSGCCDRYFATDTSCGASASASL